MKGKTRLTFAASFTLAASLALTACGVGDGTEKHDHIDQNGDGRCDLCGDTIGEEQGDHTHAFVWMRDGNQHWQECSCGEATEKEAHVQNENYRCACGYAFDAPAKDGLSSTNYWIVGTFTDNGGWGETHSDMWKFHRLITADGEGRTQYVFERTFSDGEEFKIVKDGGGYWDGEINASHVSASAKKLLGGDGTGNIKVIGGKGYYVITLHAGSGTPSIEATILFGGNKPQPHEHVFSTAWTMDANSHWHASACEHVGLKQDEAAHTYEGEKCICTVCGYVKDHTHVQGEWVSNSTVHWKNCTLCGERFEETVAEHSGVPCFVCGYMMAVSEAIKYEYDEASDSYFVTGFEYYDVEAEVRIPETVDGKKVTKITNKAFMDCNKITAVVLPDSITCIDLYSFSGCAGLTSINLGNGVKEIGMAAFENCSALTKIDFPDSLTKIGDSAFENTAITQFTVGENLVEIGMYAFRTKELTAVTFEVTKGWKVYPLLSDEGTAIDVSNPATNAIKFSKAPFQDPDGRANYTWKRG